MSENLSFHPRTPDLAACDREPIHIPGAVQPHGVLLVLQEPDLEVLQASDNTGDLLGIPAEALLGEWIERVVGEEEGARLRELLSGADLAELNPIRISAERTWDGIVHRTEGGLVLELEPEDPADALSVERFYHLVRTSLSRLQSAPDLPALCRIAAAEVRRITGFDRVMVYRFDPDWNGEVVAEDLTEGVESFRGLHFPASDIPEQARRLYTINWLRLIVSSDYRPARLVPELNPLTGAPLDLTGSVLRSVSPVHLEYLRNMAVGASMSVSLLREGRLWGLIACHAAAPRRVPYTVRSACEFLGQVFSFHLALKEQFRDYEERMRLRSDLEQLLDRVRDAPDLSKALQENGRALLRLTGAQGGLLYVDGLMTRIGTTPPEEDSKHLLGWLQGGIGSRVFATDSLPRVYEPAAAFAEVAGGLLTASISTNNRIVWFRSEAVQVVSWAGDPRKPVTDEPGGSRLHPRKSFELWKETVRGRSQPWSVAEQQAAEDLRVGLADLVLRRSEQEAKVELERLNTALERSNAELDSFAYIASHDLKEPLRGIRNYSEFLLEDYGKVLDEEGVSKLRTLVRLSRRMEELIDSLLHFSRVGALDMALGQVDLNEVLEKQLDLLQVRLRMEGVQVRVPRPLPTVRCDRARIGEVFQNLIGNAAKYNDKPEKWVEIGWDRAGDGALLFYVRDNGIGITRRHWDAVFQIFRRLHGREKYGGGSGAGLTIARKIVERHGGRLWLESEPGEGTTFLFTLPQEGGSPLDP